MQKIAAIFFAFAIAFASIGISPAHAAGAATLSLSPANVSVKTGDNFSLTLVVNPSGESLDTARANLSWDASKLEALAFDLGSQFPNLSPLNNINNTSGTLSYGGFKFGTSVTASGTFGTVTFRALKSGTATVSVTSDSRLISDGIEKINSSVFGKSTVTVAGTEVTSKAADLIGDKPISTTPVPAPTPAATTTPTITPTPTATTTPTPVATATPAPAPVKAPAPTSEKEALKYFGALAGYLPSTPEDWTALKCMVNNGCKAAKQDAEKEKKALAFYTKKYNVLPKTDMEWNVVHAIAYTNVFIKWPAAATPATPATPATVPATPATPAKLATPAANTEATALKYFGALAGKLPKTTDEWAALKCIVNDGCKATKQDAEKEKKALALYTKKYKALPKTSMEWNVIHAIAYTNIFINWSATTTVTAPAATTVKVDSSTPAAPQNDTGKKTLTLEQQAIGWFGKLTGKLPSSSADWLAVKYMVNGYKPVKQDVDAESDAVALFSGKFGKLPSTTQDWNIIAAIAYSGAF
jgi:hypothetical protein